MDTLPTLTTARLRLRQPTAADVDAVYSVFADVASMRYWSRLPMTDANEALALIEQIEACRVREDLLQWGIEEKHGAIIGTCTLAQIDRANGRGQIGFILRSDCWGRGYAREAITRVIDFAGEVLGLRRIEADVDPNNSQSLRCLERIGFRREGFLRERWFVGGQAQDTVILGLLLREWATARDTDRGAGSGKALGQGPNPRQTTLTSDGR